jgi:hypothetical protein
VISDSDFRMPTYGQCIGMCIHALRKEAAASGPARMEVDAVSDCQWEYPVRLSLSSPQHSLSMHTRSMRNSIPALRLIGDPDLRERRLIRPSQRMAREQWRARPLTGAGLSSQQMEFTGAAINAVAEG